MKLRILSAARLSFPLASAIAALLGATSLHAITLTWDTAAGDGAVITDGGGTWSDATGNWNNAGADVNWANATPDDAIFGGGTLGAFGTVTLGTAITAGSLTFNTPNGGGAYTIDTSTFGLTLNTGITANESATIQSGVGGSIILGATNAWSVAATKTLAVSSTISGATFGITKTGTGALTLSNTNTYTGQTTVTDGTLNASATNALGTGAALLVNGGTLDISTFNNTVGAVTLTSGNINGTTGILTGTSFAVESGSVSAILAGGAATLTKTTGGTVTLTGDNTYGGLTDVQAGTLSLGRVGGTIADAAAVQISGGILDVAQSDTVGAVTLSSGTISGAGTLTGASYAVTNAVGTTTISASLGSNAATLTKTGAGILTLSGTTANAYTGDTTISLGTLTLAKDPNVIAVAGNIIVNAGATLSTTVAASNQIADTASLTIDADGNFSAGIVDTIGAVTVTGGGSNLGKFNPGSNSNLSVTSLSLTNTIDSSFYSLAANSGSSTMTIGAGGLTMSGAVYRLHQDGAAVAFIAKMVLNGNFTSTGTSQLLNGTRGTAQLDLGASARTFDITDTMSVAPIIIGAGGGINKIGSGTLTLTGVNTYTGQLTVQNGTLSVATANNISTAGPLGNSALPVILGNTGAQTGILSYTGATATSTKPFTMATGGTGEFDVTVAANTLTLSGLIDGSGALTKSGLGTLVLNQTNTYSGGTTVSAGKLVMTKSSDLSNGALNVGANTFIYAPTAAGALNIGTGVLTLDNGSTIGTALGGTASQSAITSTGAAALSGTGTVNIYAIPGAAPAAGTNNLITAASGLDAGTYTLGTVFNNTNFTVSALSQAPGAISTTVTAAAALSGNVFWKGGLAGNTGVWAATNGTTQSNWQVTDGVDQPLAPGATADLVFSTATSPGTMAGMTLGADMTLRTLTVNNTATAFGLGADGFTLTLSPASSTAGITMNTGALAGTIGAKVALGAAQTWTNNSANALTVSGSVTNGANSLTIRGSGNIIVSGAIGGGAGGVTKADAGTLTLSGANTYTGATTVNGGTLTVSGSLNGTTGTALTFGGTGTFNVQEAANSTQGMGALTLSAGDGTVTSTAAGATSIATLTFGSLATRAAGGTANFTLATNTASTGATPNKIVFTSTTNVPLAGGSNDAGLFFGGTNYARYDAAGFVRAITYGTDTNAPAALSGPAVTTLGATTGATDVQFTGAARATTTSGAVSGTNTNTLAVTNGALFAVGQILTGTNIAANTYITGIAGNTLTLANAGGITAIGGTAVAAGTTLTPYNSVTAQTTGTVNTLNLSGTGASLTLSAGQTLSINGILRSGAATSGVISGGTGIQAVSSGGDMVVRTNLAGDVLTIATPILNNGGSSLTKSGAGTLLLSGTNTYAGGTFLNGGTVRITNAASFGTNTNVTVNGNSQITASGGLTYANAITVNSGTTLTLLNPATGTSSTATFSGVLSGAGNIFLPNSGTNAIQGIFAFTNTGNTGFTGNVVLSASGSGDEHFQFNSIGDGGNFTFAKNGNRQLITHTGSSNITFNTRQIVVAATMANGNGGTDRQGMDGGGSNPVSLFANEGAGTVTFTRDMVVNTIAAGTYGVLYFGGANAGDNTFSGNISDPSGTAKLAIGKFGTGKWILSGLNTYEANTLIAGGTLSVGTIANAATPQPLGIGPAIQLGVGNSGATGTLLYTGGIASTDKQVVIGAPVNTLNQAAAGSILNDGSGALTFTNSTFNPTSTSFVIPGSGTALPGNVTATRTLTLGGSYAGGTNVIQGVIQNNSTAGVVALAKTGAGTWQLSGTNTYTGTTSIAASGTLIIGGTGSLGSGLYANTISNDGTFTYGSSANQILSGVISGAGTLIKNTSSSSSLILSAANTYTGNTTIDVGTIIAKNANALGTGGTRNVSVAAGAGLSYAAAANANLSITGTLGITGGAGTVIGGSIGSTATGVQINVDGDATATGAIGVNVYGLSGVTPLAGTNTYTLVHGVGGGSSMNGGSYTLGTVFNNTNFTVGALSSTAADLNVSITSVTALTSAFWTGGLTGSTNVWAASDGTANSNWVTAAGGGATPLVPGSGANVTISATSVTTAPTATLLGDNMAINSLTIADTTNGLGLNADGNTLTIAPASSTVGITMNASVPSSTIAARVALGASQTWTNDSANDLTVSGAISGTGALTKAGIGTIVLTGSSTYTGTTTVNAGTLLLNTAGTNAFTSAITINNGGTLTLGGANKIADASVVTVNAGGIWNLNGNAETIARTAGAGSVTNTGALATLTFTGTSGTVPNAFSGANLSLAFVNSGQTFTLTGNSTHGGGTRIGGASHPTTVVLAVNNALPIGGAVTVDASGVAVLNLNGFNQTVGLLSLGSNNGGSQGTVSGSGSTLTLTAGARLDGHNNGAGLISATTLDLNGTTQTLSITGSNNASSNLTVSSVIQNGALTYNGGTSTAGALILSGANTYSGATRNDFGVIRLDNNLALRNSAIDTAGAGTYTLGTGITTPTLGGLNGSKTLLTTLINTAGYNLMTSLTLNPGTGVTNTYSGVIANSTAGLSLTKTGGGTQILSNTNTYAGGTNVNAGTLLLSGAFNLPGTGALAVNAGGNFSLSDGTARTTTANGGLTLASGAVLTFQWTGASTGDRITSSANITPTAGSNIGISIVPSGTPSGSVVLLTGGAGSTLSGSNYFLANNTNYTATLTKAATTVTIGSYAAVAAQTLLFWQGNKVLGTSTAGADNALGLSNGTASNWSTAVGTYTATGVVPGSTADVIFSTTDTPVQQSTVLGADMSVKSVTFNDAIATNIGGSNILTLLSTVTTAGTGIAGGGSAITVSSAAANPTISSRVDLGASQTWNVASGKTLTVSGIVSGVGGLTKADTGSLTLSGANTYTGLTNINGGTLKIGNATSLGTQTGTTDGTVIASGATLDLGGVAFGANNEFITASGAGVGGNGAIISSTPIASPFIGVRFLTLAGDTTLGFTNRWDVGNNASGGTLTGGGFTLNISGSGAGQASFNGLGETNLGDININLGNAVSAIAYLQGTTTLGQPAKTVTISGGSTLEVFTNGLTSYDKKFALDTGNITIDKTGGVALPGTISLTGATNIITASSASVSITASGVISGAGGLTKAGAGTLTLSNANNYDGATAISAGVLNIQNNTALGTVADGVSVTSGAALEMQGGITVGAEALALNGTGISNGGALRNISGTNLYGGLITLGSASRINSNAGLLTLDVASGDAITGTQDLTFGGAGNITIADAITTSTGTLTKDGTGTLTLSGANTYTGTTNVNQGKLLINGNQSTATGLVTVASGATLGGTGTIGGATTIQSGGIYTPGASAGTLNQADGLTIDAGGIFEWENNTINALGSAGTNWDVANVTGSTTISSTASTGSKIKLMFTDALTDFTSSFWDANQSWKFITGGVTAGNLFDTSNITVFINAILQGSGNLISNEGFFTTVVNGSDLDLKWTGESYATWAASFSGPALSNLAADADPDADGLENALEYVIGTDPRTPNQGGPTGSVVGTNLVYAFSRVDSSETSDVGLVVQVSTNLVDWTTISGYTVGATTGTSSAGVSITENGAAADAITVTIPIGTDPSKFARLNVIVTP